MCHVTGYSPSPREAGASRHVCLFLHTTLSLTEELTQEPGEMLIASWLKQVHAQLASLYTAQDHMSGAWCLPQWTVVTSIN